MSQYLLRYMTRQILKKRKPNQYSGYRALPVIVNGVTVDTVFKSLLRTAVQAHAVPSTGGRK
jgi:hypothetical protein